MLSFAQKKQVWFLNTYIYLLLCCNNGVCTRTNASHRHTHITNSQKGRNYFNFECAFHVNIVVGFHSIPVKMRTPQLLPDTSDRLFCGFFPYMYTYAAATECLLLFCVCLFDCSFCFSCFLIASYMRPNLNKFNTQCLIRSFYVCFQYNLYIKLHCIALTSFRFRFIFKLNP